MSEERHVYFSYLLRVWQERDGSPTVGTAPAWRASLEDVRTRERQAFAGLDELFEFLRTHAAAEVTGEPQQDRD